MRKLSPVAGKHIDSHAQSTRLIDCRFKRKIRTKKKKCLKFKCRITLQITLLYMIINRPRYAPICVHRLWSSPSFPAAGLIRQIVSSTSVYFRRLRHCNDIAPMTCDCFHPAIYIPVRDSRSPRRPAPRVYS